MKITDIKLHRLKSLGTVGELVPAWPGASMRFTRGGGAFVAIETDAGLTGIGPGAGPALVERAKELLVGENPLRVERHAEQIAHYLRGAGTAAALASTSRCGTSLAKPWGSRWSMSLAAVMRK